MGAKRGISKPSELRTINLSRVLLLRVDPDIPDDEIFALLNQLQRIGSNAVIAVKVRLPASRMVRSDHAASASTAV